MRGGRRTAAGALAAVFLVATMVAQHHAATVLHVVCAEHGEVVHWHGLVPGDPTDRPLGHYSGGEDEHPEHGCAVLVFLWGTPGPGAAPWEHGRAVPSGRTDACPEGLAALAGIPLLRVAPKLSPPPWTCPSSSGTARVSELEQHGPRGMA